MKEKFTRTNIVNCITDAGIERTKAGGIASAIVAAMTEALTTGKVIELRGLGTLKPRQRKATVRHNPQNMKQVQVPTRRVILFRPGRVLKATLSDSMDIRNSINIPVSKD